MSSDTIKFTVIAAAEACLVAPRTIQRRLDQLAEHGATKDNDGQWSIPLVALLAVGLRPGQPTGPDKALPPTEPSTTEMDHLRQRLAVVETERDGLRALVESERRSNEHLALALRMLTPAPPAPATATFVAAADTPAAAANPHPAPPYPDNSWAGRPYPGVAPVPHTPWWRRKR